MSPIEQDTVLNMKCLIVYAHPNPGSFNHALLEKTKTMLTDMGAEVKVRDLYALNFKTTLDGGDFTQMKQGKFSPDVAIEQDAIRRADILIFVYPIWWFGMPAIMKGYIDRVFSFGFAYAMGDGGLKGLLSDKKAVIINTTGGAEDDFIRKGCPEALKTATEVGIFETCGIRVIVHKYFFGVPYVTDEARAGMLKEIDGLKDLFK
jgi:NAD(P)H dehydrogenase (quinone)